MRGSSAVTVAAGVFIGLVLIKDGTMGKLIGNAASFLQTGAQGLKPLTNVA